MKHGHSTNSNLRVYTHKKEKLFRGLKLIFLGYFCDSWLAQNALILVWTGLAFSHLPMNSHSRMTDAKR